MAWPELNPRQWASQEPPPGEDVVPPILDHARTLYDKIAYVGTNHKGIIYETPGTSTAIATSGLWVCTTTVVDFETRERRGTALAHYDHVITTSLEQGLDEEFIEDLRLLAQQKVKARATVISPGDPSQLSPTDYTPRQISDPSHVNARLKEIFGDTLPIANVGYSYKRNRDHLGGSVLVGYSKLLGEPRKFLIEGKDVSGKM